MNKKIDMALKAIPSDEVSDHHTEVAEASRPLDTGLSPSPAKDGQAPGEEDSHL